MTIFNPQTGETNERGRILSMLMDWTTEPSIIRDMVRQKRADLPGIAQLAAMVRATVDGKPEDGAEVQAIPLEERQIAAACLAFIVSPTMRKTVANHVSRAHGISYVKAKDDLLTLRIHLGTTYGLQPEDVPPLCAGDPDVVLAGAEQEVCLFNMCMRWPAGEDAPEWAHEYIMDADSVLSPAAQDWLRAQPAEIQAIAQQFPPFALVRATQEVTLPAKDHVAIVRGYEVEDGAAVVMLSAFLDPDAARVAAKPEWLELAACRGAITREAVSAAITQEPVR